MAIFDVSMSKAFTQEGGFSDDPTDPGGATNFGISLRFLKTLTTKINGHEEGDINGDGVIDIIDIKRMTRDQAAAIYKREWWDRYSFGLMTQGIADKAFSEAINMGAGPANRLLQRALRANGQTQIVEDGVIGKGTLLAMSVVISRYGEAALLHTYKADIAGYYREIVARNPKMAKYINGWLARAYA